MKYSTIIFCLFSVLNSHGQWQDRNFKPHDCTFTSSYSSTENVNSCYLFLYLDEANKINFYVQQNEPLVIEPNNDGGYWHSMPEITIKFVNLNGEKEYFFQSLDESDNSFKVSDDLKTEAFYLNMLNSVKIEVIISSNDVVTKSTFLSKNLKETLSSFSNYINFSKFNWHFNNDECIDKIGVTVYNYTSKNVSSFYVTLLITNSNGEVQFKKKFLINEQIGAGEVIPIFIDVENLFCYVDREIIRNYDYCMYLNSVEKQ